MAKVINPTKVITGVKTRWSYANVWQAKSINGGAPKFSVSLIIPKSDTKTVMAVKRLVGKHDGATAPSKAFFAMRNTVGGHFSKRHSPRIF